MITTFRTKDGIASKPAARFWKLCSREKQTDLNLPKRKKKCGPIMQDTENRKKILIHYSL